MARQHLTVNVLTAARQRIAALFDLVPRVYVSFSGGKDSTVLLHLVMDEAQKRDRKVGVLFVDLEGQYKITISHVRECLDLYAEHADPYWVCLPLNLRNAVSQYEPQWTCWEPGREADWIRPLPAHDAVVKDQDALPFYRYNMEFEEFVEDFGEWYAGGKLTASLVGIRTQESLNRWRTIATQNKQTLQGLRWTTWKGGSVFSAFPIYDWKTEDIWIYTARSGKPNNGLYDLMHRAGLTLHQQRICQPYGDDQRKGLWLYHVIEPESWSRLVARVNGANQGALYARETGNILGRIKIDKPEGHTWESFARMLLDSMPQGAAEHYKNKIAVFLKWWEVRGYPDGIPDEADSREEAQRNVPSWRRVCKVLLRNDYWCKGLSFSQHKSNAYKKYLKVMRKRRREWGILPPKAHRNLHNSEEEES